MISAGPIKVSVGIPTLSRRHYLEQTLASALAQTLDNIEIIVSNNASTDDTASFLSSIHDPRLRVMTHETRLPLVENWNTCLRAATGEYFLLLSDDDLLEPDALRTLVATFEAAPDPERVGMVYSRQAFIDQDGRFIANSQSAPAVEDPRALTLAMFEARRNIAPCSTVMRRLDMLPGYSSHFTNTLDNAMWIGVAMRRGEIRFVDRPLSHYRIHRNESSKTSFSVLQRDLGELGKYALNTLELHPEQHGAYIQALCLAVLGAIERVPRDIANNGGPEEPAIPSVQ